MPISKIAAITPGLVTTAHWDTMADYVQSATLGHRHDGLVDGGRKVLMGDLDPATAIPAHTLAGQLNANAQNIINTANVIPDTTATRNLGSTTIFWNNVYGFVLAGGPSVVSLDIQGFATGGVPAQRDVRIQTGNSANPQVLVPRIVVGSNNPLGSAGITFNEPIKMTIDNSGGIAAADVAFARGGTPNAIINIPSGGQFDVNAALANVFRVDSSGNIIKVGSITLNAGSSISLSGTPGSVSLSRNDTLNSLTVQFTASAFTPFIVRNDVVNQYIGYDIYKGTNRLGTFVSDGTVITLGSIGNLPLRFSGGIDIESFRIDTNSDIRPAGGRKIYANTGVVGFSVVSTALTVGTLGSIIIPVKTTAGNPADVDVGNVDGALWSNSVDSKIGIRLGAAMKSVAVAGHNIPLDEGWCPVCTKYMAVGEFVAGFRDKNYGDGEGHWVAMHLKCAITKLGLTVPN